MVYKDFIMHKRIYYAYIRLHGAGRYTAQKTFSKKTFTLVFRYEICLVSSVTVVN